MNLIPTGATARTMTSLELLELVNQARAEFGESEVRRNDFTARCRDELEGEHYETFVVKNQNGTESDALQMSRDQCLYVLMRESKAVRRAVTVKLNRAAVPAELSRMEILRLAMESEEARIRAEAERDEAIRTKALIGSKREATAMATASAAKREAAQLRDALGINCRHATVIAVQRATGTRHDWLPLRRWCKAHGLEAVDVPDARYGTAKAWPAGAWSACHGVDLVDLFGEVAA